MIMTAWSIHELSDRLDALDRALDDAAPLLANTEIEPQVSATQAVIESARHRLAHGSAHTVIALVGSSGSGTSSVFNALVGAPVSAVGMRRPTTAVPHAAVFSCQGDDTADQLLDWIGIDRRVPVTDDGLDGLVLIDLPAIDSIDDAHRDEADRIIGLVDAVVVVIDAQTYADEVVHRDYVRPLVGRIPMMGWVLNKIDLVSAHTVDEIASFLLDLRHHLTDDGVDDPIVVPVSMARGHGRGELRQLVTSIVAHDRAATDRVAATLSAAAAELAASIGEIKEIPWPQRRRLANRLAHGVGVDDAADQVAEQYRLTARSEIDRTPLRWLRRSSSLPIQRSPMVVSDVEITRQLHHLADATPTTGPWRPAVRHTIIESRRSLRDAISSIVSHRPQITARQWWTTLASIQAGAGAVGMVGAVWLVIAGLLSLVSVDTESILVPTPGWESVPAGVTMAVGGLGVAVVVALIGAVLAAIAAGQYAQRWRQGVVDQITTAIDETVVVNLEEVIAVHSRCSEAVEDAQRGPLSGISPATPSDYDRR